MAVALAHSGGTGPGQAAPRDTFVTGVGRVYFTHHFTVTFDSSYPTAGESIAATVGAASPWNVLTTVDKISCVPTIAPGGTGGFTAGDLLWGVADIANKKLLLYLNAAAGTDFVQVTDTTNASLITVKCTAFGYR